ncbi:MDR family MFS transporter [Bacillus testis]|uniref:MDR family MFS transporter n=1 Tax=Bacillus testis TaxID=1622072 RepID=UPI00067F6AE1|nr:MDR family MFS transporter [Bacillus testis]
MKSIVSPGIHKNRVLTGLMIGMFFSSLEQTVVGTAMPTIVAELNGFNIFAWVTTAYMIASTTVVPIVGKLSDIYGRRKLYLLGAIIFVIGSGLCATANTMEQLVLYRGLQGVGGGMIMPLSQTIIGDIFTAEQRAKWQGVFGALYGLSSVLGPFLGGIIVDYVSWHWIFLINMPFGFISALLIFNGLKHEPVRKGKVSIDFFGIFTLIPAIILLLLGMTFGGDKFAWNSPTSYALFGTVFVLLLIFAYIERRVKDPVLDLAFFKNRVFAVSNALGFFLGLGMFGAVMFVPMFMQGILGVSPTQAGSTMTPMMIALIVSSVIGGRLLLRLKFRTVLAAGMCIAALGFYLMSTMGLDSTRLQAYSYMVVLGLGMGLVMPTITIAIQSEFSSSQLGAVTSAATFFRSIGGTIGVTVLNSVMNHTIVSNMLKESSSAHASMAQKALEALSEKTDVLFGLLVEPSRIPFPSELRAEIIKGISAAWANSFSTVFLTGLIFIIFGIAAALFIGNGRIKRDKALKEHKWSDTEE